MTDINAKRQKALEALLDLFVGLTGLPIGIYEERDGQLVGIISKESLARFEPHCQLIQQFPGGKTACETDQCNRALQAIKRGEEGLRCCHAGLYNEIVPIRVGNDVRAVILFGEMQIVGDEYTQRSLERHEQATNILKLTERQAADLKNLLLASKRYTPEQLEAVRNQLPQITYFLYSVFEREDQLREHVEKVTHELSTRLQSVIAGAELLTLKVPTLKADEVKRRADDILNSALALQTVVNNLGEFVEEYKFVKQTLASIMYEAKRLYRAEAERRGIQIQIHFEPDGNGPQLEFSKHHLQLAFNNLVHNAIKYSFRPSSGEKRFIRINGMPIGRYYAVTIENYGVGILPEEMDAIFQDGVQGKLTQGEYRTGAGKGLFFTKQVIDRHHGKIKVTSRKMSEETHPEGQPHLNQFTVYLPYEQPKEGSLHEDDCLD